MHKLDVEVRPRLVVMPLSIVWLCVRVVKELDLSSTVDSLRAGSNARNPRRS